MSNTDKSMHHAVYWVGKPRNCDWCGASHKETFYDARSRRGPWGTMCVDCFPKICVGIGTGVGQRYDYQRDLDKWLKVSG